MFVFSSKELFILIASSLCDHTQYFIYFFCLFVKSLFIQETNVCTDLLTHTIYNHIIILYCKITVELVSCRVQDNESLGISLKESLSRVCICAV